MHCPGCGAPLYAADESCPDICSKHYPGTPDGRQPVLPFPNPAPGIDTHEFSVEDTVEVPTNIPAGSYVLGWRWYAIVNRPVRIPVLSDSALTHLPGIVSTPRRYGLHVRTSPFSRPQAAQHHAGHNAQLAGLPRAVHCDCDNTQSGHPHPESKSRG
jgi:hypothetical protein